MLVKVNGKPTQMVLVEGNIYKRRKDPSDYPLLYYVIHNTSICLRSNLERARTVTLEQVEELFHKTWKDLKEYSTGTVEKYEMFEINDALLFYNNIKAEDVQPYLDKIAVINAERLKQKEIDRQEKRKQEELAEIQKRKDEEEEYKQYLIDAKEKIKNKKEVTIGELVDVCRELGVDIPIRTVGAFLKHVKWVKLDSHGSFHVVKYKRYPSWYYKDCYDILTNESN